MNRLISSGQGSGGKQMHDLIENVFVKAFGMPEPLTDSAVLEIKGRLLAFTTDSYVVDPLFFPGGDIGRLAVCGTVNDLAVSGAEPLFLSAAFIIEEGFPLEDLIRIVESMAVEALKAGVKIVTGDTKVVGRGKCDKLFITTSGTGILRSERKHISTAENVKAGDKLIVNGPLGNHAIAVLTARQEMGITADVSSDCAPLNGLISKILDDCKNIRFMRDLTRGGLATVLNELAAMIKSGINIIEAVIPVDEPVRGLCEVLGFDPLYLANEGKFVVVVAPEEEKKVLEIMRSDIAGAGAEVIGEITPDERHFVIIDTITGGRRILDMLSGMQLPRIC
jgi:hydrogenase expression/formation protein HypE